MRKIIFIDHSYHAKTRSSNFFQDMLAQRFRVHPILIDPDTFDIAALQSEVEAAMEEGAIIYIWQLDHIAPMFLAMGVPVICSPMYDGSGSLHDWHWDLFSDVRYINFSLALHEKIRAAGATSLYVKYFPEPTKKVDFSGGLRGFFWRRRPEHRMDLDIVNRVFGSQLTSLHIHDVPDTPAGKALPDSALDLPYKVTRSNWFANSSEFREVLSGCNFYIAPRLTEGIGMGFLEAMAAGMLVAANDLPTHNEYILNGTNGILFNMASNDVGAIAAPEKIGQRAHDTVTLGRQHWLEMQETIFDFIEEASKPRVPKRPFTADTARVMLDAFRKDHAAYRSVLADQRRTTPRASDGARKKPRVMLGGGFHTIEDASERFFPRRIVWASQQCFTIVPLDADEDLRLVFRDGRGKGIRSAEEAGLSAWRGGQPLPMTFEALEQPVFFQLTFAQADLKPYESIEIRSTWPLFEVSKKTNPRYQGLLLFEAEVELLQL